eukprot:1157198-Pelagomonas_calceolata.AAC.6
MPCLSSASCALGEKVDSMSVPWKHQEAAAFLASPKLLAFTQSCCRAASKRALMQNVACWGGTYIYGAACLHPLYTTCTTRWPQGSSRNSNMSSSHVSFSLFFPSLLAFWAEAALQPSLFLSSFISMPNARVVRFMHKRPSCKAWRDE